MKTEICPDCGHPFSAGYHMPGEPCPAYLAKTAPSPSVVPVEVPASTPLPWVVYVDGDGLTCIGDEAGTMSPIADFTNKEDAEFVLMAVSSHAANLAKIKALETALRDLVKDLATEALSSNIIFHFVEESKPFSEASALLALPSA